MSTAVDISALRVNTCYLPYELCSLARERWNGLINDTARFCTSINTVQALPKRIVSYSPAITVIFMLMTRSTHSSLKHVTLSSLNLLLSQFSTCSMD